MVVNPPMVRRIPRNMPRAVLGGLGDTFMVGDTPTTDAAAVDTSGWSQFMQQAPSFIKDILAIKNTQAVFDMNVQRAQQGLAPISAAAVAPQVNVGLTPATQTAVLAVLGIGAVMLLASRKR